MDRTTHDGEICDPSAQVRCEFRKVRFCSVLLGFSNVFVGFLTVFWCFPNVFVVDTDELMGCDTYNWTRVFPGRWYAMQNEGNKREANNADFNPRTSSWTRGFSHIFSKVFSQRQVPVLASTPTHFFFHRSSTPRSPFRTSGRSAAGLLFLLDLGRHAHDACGSDPGESAGAALRADLHVLRAERFRSLELKKGRKVWTTSFIKVILCTDLWCILSSWESKPCQKIGFEVVSYDGSAVVSFRESTVFLVRVSGAKAICVSLITQAFFKHLGRIIERQRLQVIHFARLVKEWIHPLLALWHKLMFPFQHMMR